MTSSGISFDKDNFKINVEIDDTNFQDRVDTDLDTDHIVYDTYVNIGMVNDNGTVRDLSVNVCSNYYIADGHIESYIDPYNLDYRIDDYDTTKKIKENNPELFKKYVDIVDNEIFDKIKDLIHNEIYDMERKENLYEMCSEEKWNNVTKDASKCNYSEEGKPVIYFDMDGVLAKWCSNPNYPKESITDGVLTSKEAHYFRDLECDDDAKALVDAFKDKGYTPRVLSASYYNAITDKVEWLKENVPSIEKQDYYIVPCNLDTINKQNFIPNNSCGILIDDNNKNLERWEGISIKYINGVNSKTDKFYCFDPKEPNATEKLFDYIADELFKKSIIVPKNNDNKVHSKNNIEKDL